jgi:hypothetical protein
VTKLDPLFKLLAKNGPLRSSRLSLALQAECGISPEAARKRLSRAKLPIVSLPHPLLPKREAFFYLGHQRGTERFWTNLHAALRETDSIYATAIDGLVARGGIVLRDEFAVVSGAPNQQSKQVPVNLVLTALRGRVSHELNPS